MSPNHINSDSLVTTMAPTPINSEFRSALISQTPVMVVLAPVPAGRKMARTSTPSTDIAQNRKKVPAKTQITSISVLKPYRYPVLRNSASGPEIGLPGRLSAGFQSGKPQNRPSAGRVADFEAFPNRVRPKSEPEARFLSRKHYCVT